MSHPPPGSRRGPGGNYPSYTSLVGSINSTGTKYVSTMGVQDSLHELIEDLENMCIVSVVPRIDPQAMLIELNVSTYSSNLGKRWASCPSVFYSIAVSNSGFFVRCRVPTMFPKMASLKENSGRLSQKSSISSGVRPLPFFPLPSCSRS
jgi:hypothetical protein